LLPDNNDLELTYYNGLDKQETYGLYRNESMKLDFGDREFTWTSINMTEYNYTLMITFKVLHGVSNSPKYADSLGFRILRDTQHFQSNSTSMRVVDNLSINLPP